MHDKQTVAGATTHMFVTGESAGYENALHAPLESAVVAFDEIAHDDVHQRVLHQRAEYEHGASGHEYVDGLTTQINPFVILFPVHQVQRSNSDMATADHAN
jgi:hypothetical protein